MNKINLYATVLRGFWRICNTKVKRHLIISTIQASNKSPSTIEGPHNALLVLVKTWKQNIGWYLAFSTQNANRNEIGECKTWGVFNIYLLWFKKHQASGFTPLLLTAISKKLVDNLSFLIQHLQPGHILIWTWVTCLLPALIFFTTSITFR